MKQFFSFIKTACQSGKKLFILVLLSFIGLATTAQTPQYYNALPTAGANVFPFNINPATGKKVQWIVAAGEFSQPSAAPAGNITNLWFRPNAACNATYTTLTVRMANIPTTTYIQVGQFYTGPMTTVLTGNINITQASALTWTSLALSTPFTYDPTMNLIIEVSQCGFTGTGFNINQQAYGTAPNYRRQYSDASSLCGVTPLATGGDLNVPAIGIDLAAANPSVTIDQASGQPDPTNATPINFTAVFSQPVTGFTTGDVTLTGTAGATTGVVTGGPTTYNVAVSGMTSSGTVIATIAAGVCVNSSNLPNLASTSTDNTVTYNLPGPSVCTTFVGTVTAAEPTTSLKPVPLPELVRQESRVHSTTRF
jgi:hypothetical protein